MSISAAQLIVQIAKVAGFALAALACLAFNIAYRNWQYRDRNRERQRRHDQGEDGRDDHFWLDRRHRTTRR